ncbi:MAG: hypothetical protein ACNYZG_09240 [Gammaproteobacteria bacterium]
MKFSVEVDIDWINDEDGSLDEQVKHQLIKGLAFKLEKQVLAESSKQMSLAAQKLVSAKTELLINSVLEQPVVISDGFRKQEYASIMDMVETKMVNLYTGKLNVNGQCTKDPLLANIDASVKSQVEAMLNKVKREVSDYSIKSAKKAVEENATVQAVKKLMTKEE